MSPTPRKAARAGTVMRFLLPILGLMGLLGGVHVLREATQSRHYPTDANSRLRVVIEPRSNRPEASQNDEDVVWAQLSFCRLEVGSDLEDDLETVSDEPLRYAVVLTPALDSTDRKQFRGCVEDWIVDNHLINVVSMDDFRAP